MSDETLSASMTGTVLFLKPFGDLTSRITSAYLWTRGEYPSFPVGHVGLLLGSTFIDISHGSVGMFDIHGSGLLERVHEAISVPPEFISNEWIKQAVVHASLLNLKTKWYEYMTYPWTKEKPLTCTGFVQHLLMLDVTNPTPYELWEELNVKLRQGGES